MQGNDSGWTKSRLECRPHGDSVKHNWSKIAVALGPAIVMVAVVWELARTNPAYNFLVEPWSLSGYETDQGWTYFAVGLVLLLLGLAVMPKRAVEVPYSATVVALAVVASSVLGLVFGPATVSITFSGVIMALLTLVNCRGGVDYIHYSNLVHYLPYTITGFYGLHFWCNSHELHALHALHAFLSKYYTN